MNDTQTKGQAMWGGRFTRTPTDIMQRINASIDIDKRLAHQDIMGSRVHANMLAKQGIITDADNEKIQDGLVIIAGEIETNTFAFKIELEDIHMNVEARLRELIGDRAGKLHTARSRNDQVVTDFRLWVRGALDETIAILGELQKALVNRADQHTQTVMPGFTHLQTAQPIILGHHLLAYVEMFARDISRLEDCQARTNQCPLGAAALAGTGFDIDRHITATALGFDTPMANSMDAVSSRDFALEALSSLSIAATHLSRLAEEIVLWTSAPFSFAKLSDAWSTGSSIMPQKRNPDAAELIRGKASQLSAAFLALQGAIKALPLTYAKDLQDDKALTFAAFDDFILCTQAMIGMMETIRFNTARMREEASKGYSTATDLADWLVRRLGLPFRDAHHITGAIVAYAEANVLTLPDVPLVEMQSIDPRITDEVYSVLSVDASVRSRNSFGGTAPECVAAQVRHWHNKLT